MFAVKIFNNKKNRNKAFNSSVENIISYIKGSLNKQVSVIKDSKCIEFFSKEEPVDLSGDIVAELVIRKKIVINTSDLHDRSKLDKYMFEIKQFCEKASDVEDVKYIPINYRDLNRDVSNKNE